MVISCGFIDSYMQVLNAKNYSRWLLLTTMEPLLNKPNQMVTLSVQNFLVEWWGDMSWDSMHPNFVSMGMSCPILLHERVRSWLTIASRYFFHHAKKCPIIIFNKTASLLILLDKYPMWFQRCIGKSRMVGHWES